MDFDATKISDLISSVDYLINSMSNTGKYLSRGELLAGKPSWLGQTERFSSFFDRIKDNSEIIEKFRTRVVLPLYNRYNVNLNSKLIDTDNKVQDTYIKIKINNTNDFKLKTEPEGIYLNIERFFLPVSEAYSRVLAHETKNKDQNNLYATCILIGFYSVLYHSALPDEGKENLEGLYENITLMVSALDVLEKPEPVNNGGPMAMFQNFMKNIDLGQIGEMMSKITNDDTANGNLGDVLKKMGSAVEKGENPFNIMEDIVKEASAHVGKQDDDEDDEPEVVSAPSEVDTEVEVDDEMPELESIEEEESERVPLLGQ